MPQKKNKNGEETTSQPTGHLPKAVDLDGVLKEHNGPKLRPNCCSALLFWPATRIVAAGNKAEIQHNQLWTVREEYRASTTWAQIKPYWKKELQLHKNGGQPSLFRAIRNAFIGQWMVIMLLLLIYNALSFVTPVLLPRLMSFIVAVQVPADLAANLTETGAPISSAIAGVSEVEAWHGYVYVAAILVATVLGSFCNYHAQLLGSALGIRIRSAFTLLIYKKALYVRPSKTVTTGLLTNLIANDAQFICDTIHTVNAGFLAPLIIIAATVLMGLQIGWFCLIPIAMFILSFPLVGLIANRIAPVRAALLHAIDVRVKFVKEFISAIRIVKYYAWEKPFNTNILNSREAELHQHRKSLAIRAQMVTILQNVPVVGTALTFIFYGIGRYLDFSAVFTTLAYLNLLRGPFMVVPLMATFSTQYKTTFDRVQDFLLEPELQRRPKEDDTAKDAKYAIVIENGSFTYTPEDKSSSPVLTNVNLKIKRGELAMIVGKVGSGKSTLAQAAINEVACCSGSAHTYGTVAYVPQEAWIINATIRDNITFGKPYNEKLFKKITKLCCLEPDFDLMPARDLTEIGERGVNLSGGQKQRISIARALYADKDVYILDDILSAVDAHVAQDLATNVIVGYLKDTGKTVLFVTNQLQFLPLADKVIFINNGQIAEQGSYTKLKDAGKEFTQLINGFGLIDKTKEQKQSSKKRASKASKIHPTSSDSEADQKPEDAEMKKKGALVMEEESEVGNVSPAVYNKYIIYGGRLLFTSIFMTFILRVAAATFGGIWLSYWTQDFPENPEPHTTYPSYIWMTIYLAVSIAEVLGASSGAMLEINWNIRASRIVNFKLMESLSRATVAWFDATPVGRILSRVTKDFVMVDVMLPQAWDQVFNFTATLLGLYAQLAIGNIYLIIVAVVVTVIYFILFAYFRRPSIAIQRLDSLSRAPIISHLAQTMEGASTVRAFRMGKPFAIACMNKIDDNTVDFYGLRYAFSWFGLRLDWCGTAMITATFLAIVLTRNFAPDNINASFAALAMSSTSSITFLMASMSQALVELETKMNSFERLIAYDNLPQEPPLHIEETAPPKEWPAKGAIEFKDLSISYNGTDKVLNRITAKIKPGEKIGIVGRTGAGKSTLVTALFRLMDFHEGTVLIDGVDISKIGLHDLRRKLSIIPQTPTLFIGSIRYNVDPFNQHSDDDIWRVLEMVQLKEYVSGLEGKLDAQVEENGQNFSVGQRQLLAMARALLRNAPILLLDEATAATDAVSDQIIQKLIRKHFRDKTILTIAHRLNTIMDSDRVMVLHKGEMVEFDKPAKLLENKKSIFTSMVKATGPASAAYLTKLARGEVSILDAIPVEAMEVEEESAENENMPTEEASDTKKNKKKEKSQNKLVLAEKSQTSASE